jgi:hypothetical protein
MSHTKRSSTQNVAESDDAPMFTNPLGDGRITLCELRQSLADDLEFALHGRTKHRILLIIRKRLAGRESCDQFGCALNIVRYFFASRSIEQGLGALHAVAEIGVTYGRSVNQIHRAAE